MAGDGRDGGDASLPSLSSPPPASVPPVAPILTEIAAVSAQVPLILPQLASVAAGFAARGTPFGARVGLMGVTHVSAHFATVLTDLTLVGAHLTPILSNFAAIVPRVGIGVRRWR